MNPVPRTEFPTVRGTGGRGQRPYLWPDATYVTVREGGRIISRAVIVAVAVDEDGTRGVKLVIADDHKGLRAAACRVFNGEPSRRHAFETDGEWTVARR